jgi:hypothetical protein
MTQYKINFENLLKTRFKYMFPYLSNMEIDYTDAPSIDYPNVENGNRTAYGKTYQATIRDFKGNTDNDMSMFELNYNDLIHVNDVSIVNGDVNYHIDDAFLKIFEEMERDAIIATKLYLDSNHFDLVDETKHKNNLYIRKDFEYFTYYVYDAYDTYNLVIRVRLIMRRKEDKQVDRFSIVINDI